MIQSKFIKLVFPKNRILYSVNYSTLIPQLSNTLKVIEEPFKVKRDPLRTTVMLFPGDGNQFVGMGEELLDVPIVPKIFETAKKILGHDILDLCLNGPNEELDKIQNSQIAIFLTSLGAIEKLRIDHPGLVEACVTCSGFGVGEITALVFAGALSFEDGLRLVKIRSEAMQHCSEVSPGFLATILFGADARIKFACKASIEWCLRKGIDENYAICQIAHYMFPHCKVIGGHIEALNFLQANGKEFGIRKISKLPFSGAFHTRLMYQAGNVLKNVLKKFTLSRPLIPVYSNYDAKPYRNKDQIVYKLARQVYNPVKWEQIMHIIYSRKQGSNFPKTLECGPGNTLLKILKMNNLKAYQQSRAIKV